MKTLISTEIFWIFIQGIRETLEIATVSLLLGLIFGVGLAFIQKTEIRLIKGSFSGFCIIIQSIPEILTLFSVYFGLDWLITIIVGSPLEVNPFIASVLTLALLFGVYSSQLFLTALSSVPNGEKEAGSILGLSTWQKCYYIVLPNVWEQVLPGLENLWLILLKDTVLISFVGGSDLMSRTQVIIRNTQEPFIFYSIISGIYLFLTYFSNLLTKKMRVSHV